jgi:hypothetical protein
MDAVDDVDSIRRVLSRHTIYFDKLEDNAGIFDQADAFVNLSRGNETVEEVDLCLATDPDTNRYAIWDKIAEGIGNLQALREITIVEANNFADDEEDPRAPDWEILACILRRLRRGVQLCMRNASQILGMEALSAFAEVIRGQAMITGFSAGDAFHFGCLDFLCSALLTLPALEKISFQHDDDQGPVEAQSLESMVKLLQSPSLRDVEFESVVFTNTFSKAVAKALKDRSEITRLRFLGCSLLQDLAFDSSSSCSWLSPLFLALQLNTGLKELHIDGIELIDEKLSTAMKLGLTKNSTLKTLNLRGVKAGDNDTCLWREALSFLRTNAALKTLDISFERNVTNSRVATFRTEILAALWENESLETLFMMTPYVSLENYITCVAALQPNTTLKKFQLSRLGVDKNKSKDLIPVLKKNYGLETIPEIYHRGVENVRSIFDLNRAGRRYLVQDGSSISKGVDVLSRVNDDINSVFFHLLENPRLCDRSAVEVSSTSIGNVDNAAGGSTPSPGNRHIGEKRELHALSHTGMGTRRRLE